jgi:hypothetical protein
MNRILRRHLSAFALAGFLMFAEAAEADPFTIAVNFTGGLTPSQQAIFSTAANTWMNLLPEYQPGITIPSLNINASGVPIDGPGGILGQAGPTATTGQGGFILSTAGIMRFDSADLANMEAGGILLDVIIHEMAHVMGLGTLWVPNGVYVTNSGRFTGASAVNAYQTEWDPAASWVPVELGGGPGTANAHWDELTSVTYLIPGPHFGKTLTRELMTGFLHPGSFISGTTVGSFVDIGYLSVPEPGALILLGFGLASVVVRRRRRE